MIATCRVCRAVLTRDQIERFGNLSNASATCALNIISAIGRSGSAPTWRKKGGRDAGATLDGNNLQGDV